MRKFSASDSGSDDNTWSYVGYIIVLAMIVFHATTSAYMQ